MNEVIKIIGVCTALFLTGVIDAIAGGGGLISIPVFLALGLPVRNAYACNKLVAFTGATTSASVYRKKGFLDKRGVWYLAVAAVVGDLSGTQFVYLLPDRLFRHALLVILPIVAVFTLVNKGAFHYDKLTCESGFGIEQLKLLGIGLFIGLYDSLIGAAGATIGLVLLASIQKYDVRTANGTLKAAFIAACLSSLLVYLVHGDVIWHIAVPAAGCNIAGNFIGAGFATEKGAKMVRPLVFIVVLIYVMKTVVEFIR